MGSKTSSLSKPIKRVYGSDIVYWSDPPQYSPYTVLFEDDTKVEASKEEILKELKRQKKMYLWSLRNKSDEDLAMSNFINKWWKENIKNHR